MPIAVAREIPYAATVSHLAGLWFEATMQRFRTIGVLGGMGPVATAHFYHLLLTLAQQNYAAVQDADYPHIIIDSIPLEGTTERGIDIASHNRVYAQLLAGVRTLEKAGAELVAIPCNTAHVHLEMLRQECCIPIISIIDSVAKKLISSGIDYVTVLSSETTYERRLYERALSAEDILCATPNEEVISCATALIIAVMGGRNIDENRDNLLKQLSQRPYSETQAIVLGCTELSVAIQQGHSTLPIYDSLAILAEDTLNAADGDAERDWFTELLTIPVK